MGSILHGPGRAEKARDFTDPHFPGSVLPAFLSEKASLFLFTQEHDLWLGTGSQDFPPSH